MTETGNAVLDGVKYMEINLCESNSRRYMVSAVIFIVVGIALICSCFIGFTFLDKSRAEQDSGEVIAYLTSLVGQYDDVKNSEKINDLMNLEDKTKELSRCVAAEAQMNSEFMDEYAAAQRLSGAAVLDENRRVLAQTLCDGDTFAMWCDVINTDNVIEIIKNPQKVYLNNIEKNGKKYDFAAVARTDAPGIVIAYMEKNPGSEGESGMTLQFMLDGLELKLNGAVVISDGDNILGSNRAEFIGKTDVEFAGLFSGSFYAKTAGLDKILFDGRVWYGKMQEAEDYEIYVIFPASEIFKTRNAVIGYAAAAYAIFCLIYLIRKRYKGLKRMQMLENRCKIIKAIGKTYNSGIQIDLRYNSIESVEVPVGFQDVFKENMNAAETLSYLINRYMAGPFKKEHLKYVDLSTVEERLKGQKYLSLSYQDIYGDWYDSFIIPQEYDENDRLRVILLISRNINEVKQRELGYKEEARLNAEKAERMNNDRAYFLRRMSHDIRTPVNGIRGIVGISRMYAGNEEKQEECRNKIIKSCEALLDIVNASDPESGAAAEKNTLNARESINGAVILLVEDDSMNMEISDFLLRSEGATVVKAWNGKEAVDAFASSEAGYFDVVLMDITMPVMNGLEAARRIRAMQRPDAKSVPIIAVTANAFTDDREESFKAGMNEHITKPADVDKLIATICKYINK